MYPGILIAAARRRIKQAVLAHVADRRLTPQQFWMIVAVHESPGISPTEIADRIRSDAPTVSRALAPLVERGVVKAESDPEDRRRTKVSLSPTGRKLAAELAPIAREVREAVVDGMTAQEIGALTSLLNRIVENLDRLERRRTPGVRP